MNDNNYNEDSHYAMGVSLMWKFAGDNIPQVGNLISHISIRMQMLIPQLNTEYFYRLSVVDSFNVDLVENDKYEILYNPKDSVTLLLIKKTKDSDDDITNKSDIKLPINSISSLDFLSNKSILKLSENLDKNLIYFLTNDTNKYKDDLIIKIFNKEELGNVYKNIKNNILEFLTRVYSNDIVGLIKEYDYIETSSLRGIIEAINENDKLYEAKKSHDSLQIELNANSPINHKKVKL
jgi:hypothetical protein